MLPLRPPLSVPVAFLRPWPAPSTLKQCTQLHGRMTVSGALLHPPALAHLLVSLSDPATAGDLGYAFQLFSRVPRPSTFLWNTLIKACSRHGDPGESIRLYRRMRREGMEPDAHTFQFLFRACGLSASVQEGRAGHGSFLRAFGEGGVLVGNSLIHMYSELGFMDAARRVFDEVNQKDVVSWTTMVGGYAKARLVDEARMVFDEMPVRNVVSWTSLMAAYSQVGRAEEAVAVFKGMLLLDVMPDSVAIVSVLSACSQLRDLELGKWVHLYVDEQKIRISRNLTVALVDMYSKCGDLSSARRVFDSTGWNILPACNAMIDGYCKLGHLDMARSLFDFMDDRDIISFNSMISGYIQNSKFEEALTVFAELRASGLKPDNVSMVSLLTACASLGTLEQGKTLHGYILVSAIPPDVFLGTALLDMYAKCGRIDQALLVFEMMDEKDMLAWTAIISGLAMNGKGKIALDYFLLMQEEGIRPNAVAYIGVLSACSHSGLVDDGRRHFEEMRTLHRIEPEIEHYGCMIDLLARGGHLSEAEGLVESMPMEPNSVIWASLLAACSIHRNLDLAEKAAKHLLHLEPHADAVYVQLCNIYARSGQSAHASEIRRMMEKRGIKKTAGCSSIVVLGQVHEFIAGDKSHPEILEIQKMMHEISKRLKVAGYVPNISRVIIDIDEEEKEQNLFAHSERMAVAFGLMKLSSHLPIHILKNLRICEDCHLAIKFISKIWNRNIIVRDRSRFHHFTDGQCSCNDFW
uniref:Pentatricopeptide repeat-containing protein At2g29760, chloroplastic n=1 Tax=Anthurium amnicola TaxID=1678845 RepID=A0A1D1YTS7_9ARAE